jgi:hypothetical protein
VAGMEADDVACAMDGLHGQQRMGWFWCGRGGRWADGGIVVLEAGCVGIGRVELTSCPGVSGAQVALRVVGRKGGGLVGICVALPWTVVAVWGDEDVFVCEGVD